MKLYLDKPQNQNTQNKLKSTIYLKTKNHMLEDTSDADNCNTAYHLQTRY